MCLWIFAKVNLSWKIALYCFRLFIMVFTCLFTNHTKKSEKELLRSHYAWLHNLGPNLA